MLFWRLVSLFWVTKQVYYTVTFISVSSQAILVSFQFQQKYENSKQKANRLLSGKELQYKAKFFQQGAMHKDKGCTKIKDAQR